MVLRYGRGGNIARRQIESKYCRFCPIAVCGRLKCRWQILTTFVPSLARINRPVIRLIVPVSLRRHLSKLMFQARAQPAPVGFFVLDVVVEQLHTNVRQITDSHTANHPTRYGWLYLLDWCLIGIVGTSAAPPSSSYLRGTYGVVKWQWGNAEGGKHGQGYCSLLAVSLDGVEGGKPR
ncbi:unnamed protein product [Sphacelaria rigidula]